MQSFKTFIKYQKRFNTTAVVNYSRPDLTKKWMNRIHAKANDSFGQESANKLSTLVDFYMKPPGDIGKNSIDWDYWQKTIRTEGIVGKMKQKNEDLAKQTYNIDSIALKAAHITEKYNDYGLFLKYNYDLWMEQYVENLNALYGAMHLGDISMISSSELNEYYPGIIETNAGWRETGYSAPCK